MAHRPIDASLDDHSPERGSAPTRAPTGSLHGGHGALAASTMLQEGRTITLSGDQPLAWEYGDRPDTGQGVPVAGEPRDEEAPGVPRARSWWARMARTNASAEGALEEREVRAVDPELSAEPTRV
jgi:hypothetical protein